MNNEERGPVLSQSYGSISLLTFDARVFESDKWVKEYLASLFESYAMFI